MRSPLLVLTAVLLGTLPPGGTFVDDDNSVHQPNIEAIAAEEITRGCNPPINDRFCPDDGVTRGEMAAFLTRAKNLKPVDVDHFTDDSGHTFEGVINSLAEGEITRGCNPPSNSRFCPDREMTRGEMAAMLVRAFGYSSTHHDSFSDDRGHTFEADINALAAKGITKGCNPPLNTHYCPNDTVTRAEMATFLTRALGLEPIVPPDREIVADVRFSPGDPVESIVSDSGPNTVFAFSSGVYRGVSIKPKSGQVFFGESGAVLKGNGAGFAFRSGASDVVIDGLEMTGYEPASKRGVVQGGRDWLVQNNHIHHNGEVGIHSINGGIVKGNNLHHNGRFGISGVGFRLIENNEIAFNATEEGHTSVSGGAKFVRSADLVIKGNFIHDNYSNGLHVDIGSENTLTTNNRVVKNRGSGIVYEIGCAPGGVIRNNHVEGNGFPDKHPNWMADTAGMVISMTGGVEIYGNTLVNNTKGIGAIEWAHGDVDLVACHPHLQDLKVHDNVITQSGGAAAGIDATTNVDKVWSSWNNGFANNTYNLSGGAGFRWKGDWLTYSEWKAVGLG